MVRRYCLLPQAEQLLIQPAGDQGKPPGSGLRGTAAELTLRLQPPPAAADGGGGGADAQQHVQQLLLGGAAPAGLLASAEAAVGCLQQLMGMLRALAPPVRLERRLNGVLLQVCGSLC